MPLGVVGPAAVPSAQKDAAVAHAARLAGMREVKRCPYCKSLFTRVRHGLVCGTCRHCMVRPPAARDAMCLPGEAPVLARLVYRDTLSIWMDCHAWAGMCHNLQVK